MNGLLKKAVAEFVGVTLFLTAIISATQMQDTRFANVALATTLGLMILLTASTSGGHLNPAVSLYFLAKKAIGVVDFIVYVVAQLAGAAVGVLLGNALAGNTHAAAASSGNLTGDLIGELVATAILVWLVGHLAANNHGDKIPFAVGAWVLAASMFTLTGAQANPAVAFGLLTTGADGTWIAQVVIAQVLGALVAVVGTMFVTSAAKK